MTGPEHYREAERLTQIATDYVATEPDEDYVHEMYLLGKAQVHATLALVAATATTDTDRSIGKAGVAWREVVS